MSGFCDPVRTSAMFVLDHAYGLLVWVFIYSLTTRAKEEAWYNKPLAMKDATPAQMSRYYFPLSRFGREHRARSHRTSWHHANVDMISVLTIPNIQPTHNDPSTPYPSPIAITPPFHDPPPPLHHLQTSPPRKPTRYNFHFRRATNLHLIMLRIMEGLIGCLWSSGMQAAYNCEGHGKTSHWPR